MFDVSAFYTKKFHKPGRTISWIVSEAYNKNETHGYLNSETDFYNTLGVKDSAQVVNQYKTTNTTSSVVNSNITYSEPLSKTFSLLFNYGLGINSTTTDRKSFDQAADGTYTVLDPVYSNNYQFNQLTNQVGAIFNYKKGKVNFNFGTKASDVDFKQVDEYTGNVYRRDFINWLPQARLQYQPSLQKSFSFNYNGNTSQPTIDQIQPVKVNTDPQNITIGNANLKPSFTNSFNVFYNTSKVVSGASSYISGSYYFTTNNIVASRVTDLVTAKTTTQSVNLTGKTPFNYYLYASTNRKIQPVGINIGLNVNTNGSVGYSYVNNQLSETKTYSYSPSLSLSKYEAKKYSFSASGGPSYTINENSLQPQINNNAAGLRAYAYFTYYLPLKFLVNSDINYNYTAPTQAFTAEYKTIWNASLGKTFFKGDNLKLSLSANDMLNQNINFNRSVSGSNITQTSTNGIKRYLMFSIQWDFTKFGTEPTKN